MSEEIRTFWRVGYFKLLDQSGLPDPETHVTTEDGEWRKILWRFYWRES